LLKILWILTRLRRVKLLVLWSMDIFFLTTKGLMLLCRLNPPEAGKDADKGGRSTIEEMPYSLNLAIYTWDGRPPGSSGKSQL
jgi:hypothetical protein